MYAHGAPVQARLRPHARTLDTRNNLAETLKRSGRQGKPQVGSPGVRTSGLPFHAAEDGTEDRKGKSRRLEAPDRSPKVVIVSLAVLLQHSRRGGAASRKQLARPHQLRKQLAEAALPA